MLVRNNVQFDSLIFGSAIAFESGVYSKYPLFCPYAYKKNNTVRSHDIAVNYNYLDPTTEWENNSMLLETTVTKPLALLKDGHWTYPYFDCGGGDIWMVTYSSPIFFFDQRNDTLQFRGVATIDIEMTNIDINQCDADPTSDQTESKELDMFRGTHKCAATTKCVAKHGLGFRTGAYDCYCEDGYYFPYANAEHKAFNGTEVEEYFRYQRNVDQTLFMCIKCAPGCDTCVDGSPCLRRSSEVIRLLMMILMVFTIAAICIVSGVTFMYRKQLAIKTASPLFLQLMCLGGILSCFQYFILFLDVSLIVCTIRIWPLHLGFFVMYGSLIMKTWRISVIFSVGTTKRIHLPDQMLIQRFGIIVAIAFCLLMSWTLTRPPTIETIKTDDTLKFYVCSYGVWEYAFTGVEVAFLLYGGYLCYTVRKAPAHFNESKHITWSVYNAIILGTFMALVTRFILISSGPDMLYLLNFIQIQVYVTVTMAFIFAPKFWAVYKKVDISETSTNVITQTITGRVKQTNVFPQQAKPEVKKTMTAGTQTNII
ncbi:hypothetical protein ACJMK2_036626 [Sinanodonta woodiana]|uniref:G-protein coupled receptors family 3 profile domain-containing protein n=1 Tax=Sinanodonta woodiana TaxID=1069815 RepID=A0ABD3WLY7_SINWO